MNAINPATEELISTHAEHTPSQVNDLLDQATRARQPWRQTPLDKRTGLLRQAARILRRDAARFANLITSEMGKPIAQAEAEVEKCAAGCDHFADNAASYLANELIKTDADQSYVQYDPLGAVLAIMPWNFPFWQVFRFAAPALAAGNVGILKHAPNVPGCSLAIERIFRDAGFPPGVFTSLLIDTPLVESIIQNPIISAVTLTGSSRAGKAVALQSGHVLKKVVLELGGSDPFIVLSDADIPSTAKAAAAARTQNAGQSCIAAKRFIIVGDPEPFTTAFAAAMSALKVGNPMDRSTDIGPLARRDLLDNLESQVQRSIAAGARPITGGHPLTGKGFFYPPTVLSDVRPGMPAFDEETFGPVAAVIQAKDIDHAIELANQSPYGLGASIWTNDIPLAQRLASRIDSGSVFINGPVKSDPRLPFGGIKQSGHGRELARHGIQEFVNVKTVWVKG
ncbi:MAG TPA: NAD-dependent succinate-semialdehyde dehydrogenase [Tepidisphaeraceae bacterium]|jgi:succinate-semialdehyde dehydrogenase/glutarate-semialdehyde dehydrogenase